LPRRPDHDARPAGRLLLQRLWSVAVDLDQRHHRARFRGESEVNRRSSPGPRFRSKVDRGGSRVNHRLPATAVLVLAMTASAAGAATAPAHSAPAPSAKTAAHSEQLPTLHAAMPKTSVSRANLDTTCAPCRDFNRFANGGWIDRNPVPPAFSTWGSFTVLAEKNRDVMHTIVEEAKANTRAPAGS